MNDEWTDWSCIPEVKSVELDRGSMNVMGGIQPQWLIEKNCVLEK